MNSDSMNKLLNDLGVHDADERAAAESFVNRPPEEQRLWLFMESRKQKVSWTPHAINTAYSSIVGAVLWVMLGGQKPW